MPGGTTVGSIISWVAIDITKCWNWWNCWNYSVWSEKTDTAIDHSLHKIAISKSILILFDWNRHENEAQKQAPSIWQWICSQGANAERRKKQNPFPMTIKLYLIFGTGHSTSKVQRGLRLWSAVIYLLLRITMPFLHLCQVEQL